MLKCLINKEFNCMSRAIDMLCLFIGSDYIFSYKSDNNIKNIKVSEYALHIQTQWRFIQNDMIILGSQDIYKPYSHDVADNWNYDIIGRKNEEGSIFNAKVKTINCLLKDDVVKDASVSIFGDIRIIFSNGTAFESFYPASFRDEAWRLIDYKNDIHTIFYDV